MDQLLDTAQSYYSEVLRLFALCITLITLRLRSASTAAKLYTKHRDRWLYYLDERSYVASNWLLVRILLYGLIVIILAHIILILIGYISIHDQFLGESDTLAYFVGEFILTDLLELKSRVLTWAKVILLVVFGEFIISAFYSRKHYYFDENSSEADPDFAHLYSKSHNWSKEAKGNWLKIDRLVNQAQPINDDKLSTWEPWIDLVQKYKLYRSHNFKE